MTGDRRETVLPTVDEMLARLGIDAGRSEPQELPHNRRLTPGVWRVRIGDDRPAVLKYLRADRDPGETRWDAHWTSHDQDPRRWNYWAREPLAYRRHLTDVYAEAGIRAPVCLGSYVDERDAVLLLEWVDGQPGESWPVGLYGPAAEALGRGQAGFLVGESLPAFTWLSEGFLRQYSSEKVVEWELLDDDAAWQHPIALEVFPAPLRDSARFVHANRERLYQISESLPQTLCHLDVWPKNLVRQAGGEVALIDWAFAGQGSIAEDVGNLVPDACFDHFISAAHLSELEQVTFDGYLRGLRSAGWSDDPRLVQLGMWSSSVKYDWLTPLTLAQLRQDRQHRYGGEGAIDAAFKFRERGQALLFVAGWARQAIELADHLGL